MGTFIYYIGRAILWCLKPFWDFLVSIFEFLMQIAIYFLAIIERCYYYVFDIIAWLPYQLLDILFSFATSIMAAFRYTLNYMTGTDVVSVFDFSGKVQNLWRILQDYSWVDNIFPVSTAFLCLSVYLATLGIWIVYKTIKSWIPSVSGS